jgi:IS4 transposase
MPRHLSLGHELVFKWLILMHITAFGQWTLAQLARGAARHITEWRFQRLLKARYWNVRLILWWAADQVISALPPPRDTVAYLITDGSTKDKRGQKGPVSQKGKTSKFTGYFFGYKFVVLMLAWDGYRIPIDFALVLPKNDPDYQKENKLFRDMLQRAIPRLPAWVKLVVVIGDSAYASKENMKYIKNLDKKDSDRRWGYVLALAKTWKLEDGQRHVKDLVKHTNRKWYRRTAIPPLTEGAKGRRTFSVFFKRTSLAHLGEVTMVLSKKGPNASPKNTKVLVTNLPELSARQVLMMYKRRWPIEILFRELKSGLGLGQHQVTKTADRVEKSVGVSLIAYLILLRARHHEIKPGKPWSIFQLKNSFTWEVYHQQIEHNVRLEQKKYMKAA